MIQVLPTECVRLLPCVQITVPEKGVSGRDVPVPQIQEEIVGVVRLIPQERTVEEIVDDHGKRTCRPMTRQDLEPEGTIEHRHLSPRTPEPFGRRLDARSCRVRPACRRHHC